MLIFCIEERNISMPPNIRLTGFAALLAATTGWGSLFLVSKGILDYVDPVWFTLIRYTFAVVIFTSLLILRGSTPWQKLKDHAGALALRGFAGFGVFGVMLLAGLAHSVPSHGAVLIATQPMTTQFMRWALDGERPSRATLMTSALALLGVAIVAGLFNETASKHGSTLYGDAIAFIGTLGWVWYTRGTTKFPNFDVIEYTAFTVLWAWPLLLIMAIISTALDLSAVPTLAGLGLSWHGLLYVGLVPTALSVLAFNFGVRTLGAVTGMAFLNFVPISALLMSMTLGRQSTISELIGIAMVIAALLIHTVISRQASVRTPSMGGADASSSLGPIPKVSQGHPRICANPATRKS
jgi:drug/metabolite transporter (DMT)-like permease